ncbi:MSHA biogenesis protein MshK [Shewanella sp. OPT22]|nr:MSHA biogenesis protein MshK [Shewanella sp. OPT22]
MLRKTNLVMLLSSLLFLPQLQAKSEISIDPTRPGVVVTHSTSTKAQTSAWKLTSIVMGDKPFAIIDDQIKQIGDKIHGVKITSITSDSVTLSDGRELALFESVIEHKG